LRRVSRTAGDTFDLAVPQLTVVGDGLRDVLDLRSREESGWH
jgi:hypothetical protein